MKKLTITSIFFMLLISSFGISTANASDIDNHQMVHELNFLISKGVLRPDGKGNYYPNRKVTRGEFAVYIARLLEIPPSTKYQFTDLQTSNPLTIEIQNAAGAGILSGYPDRTFKPNLEITRQQMAGMLNKALRFLELPSQTVQLPFKDSYRIDPSFTTAVATSVNLNIIRGSTEANGVYFLPKNNATIGHAAAFLFRLVAVAEALKPVKPVGPEAPVTPEKPIEKDVYQLATIINGEAVKGKQYESYQDALSNWSKGNQVIYKNQNIITMSSGLAVSKKTATSTLANIYNEDKKSIQTYVTIDTDMQYLSSDEEYVKIQFADRIGYVKQESIKLIPYSMVTNRSYFSNKNGELVHTIFNHSVNYPTSYVAGRSPSFLQEGKIYYSWNGTKFYDQNSVVVGEAYSYYQYLPARSKTNYTAQEINSYIDNELARLENLYKQNPKQYSVFANATTKSKLIGLGTYLKKVEAEKQINALMILALAQHESLYGLSTRAQNHNNLFGLRVYDDNPANDLFISVEENIDELINLFWNKNYIPPNASYANGAAFGNKNIGFNVKYASDPYWGSKAAGHYYRIDKALGFKDITNAYKIGITTIAGLNVRINPSLNNAPLFRYEKQNMPIIIHEVIDNGSMQWVKTNSDLFNTNNVYISNDYVKELNIIR